MPNRRGTERLAAVRLAAFVALVLSLDTVIDGAPARAVAPATTQLHIEGVEGVGVERSHLHGSEQRGDVVADVPLVERLRPGRAVELVQVARQ